jgi:Uma2 family endonuclease
MAIQTQITPQDKIWTYEDYAALPDDGNRYEVIEGELVMAPAPRVDHQRCSFNLGLIIGPHVKAHGLGEVFAAPCDVVLDRRNVLQPDLIFISRDRSKVVTELNLQGAPDLAVEILSPSTARRDRTQKMRIYARHGVPHLWLLDAQAQTLEEFVLDGATYRLTSTCGGDEVFRPALFPGLEVPLKEVWGQPTQEQTP